MRFKILFSLFVILPRLGLSQDPISEKSQINGSFETNLQSYLEDESIGAESADEVILNNAYLNIIYRKNNFSAGIRYESYLNALKDYDIEYNGNGIPYRFARYIQGDLDITVGNYYEQFGSGLVFRTYEDKSLGVDNSMDGIKIKYSPMRGLYLKSFIGKSRTYFTYSNGIIRGADAEININDVLNLNSTTYYTLGGSIVSRYQRDDNPRFHLPENVAILAGRVNIIKGGIQYYGEYAYKINDPVGSITENNYAAGRGIVNNLSYSKKGFGISFASHWIDNMEFRSERAKEKEFIINYIPTLSKQHTYTLLTLYPCATQSNGESGFQTDVFYKIKKGTPLGGKYGTKININFSQVKGLNGGNSVLNDSINYTSEFFNFKDGDLYFSDLNIEIDKKITKKLKLNAVLAKQRYNKDILEGKSEYGIINSTIGVIDVTYKLRKGHAIRIELQELLAEKEDESAKDGDGDWSMILAEYTISPHWFFAIQDMYNWGNHDASKQQHYFNASIGFLKGYNRFTIGYGRKRAGIFCVGGVCKPVPSSNGIHFGISSNF